MFYNNYRNYKVPNYKFINPKVGEEMGYYDKKELAKKLDVTEALVTKYALLFVKYNYEFITDGVNNERLFTDQDFENFKQVIALKKVMKVEEAIKQVVKGKEVTLYNSVTPQILDSKLDAILDEVRFIKDENKAIKEELVDVKKELVETRAFLSDRDIKLMEGIRLLQEQKQAEIETAATTPPSKKWWEFWK